MTSYSLIECQSCGSCSYRGKEPVTCTKGGTTYYKCTCLFDEFGDPIWVTAYDGCSWGDDYIERNRP